ncbi:olfactory receptor 1G1-like, partial [Gallus gallus]|uniref:olfactory receptor 1G1-like n=1 Tax=Gallus gallus TaxID=9031 RepID=UPI001EFF8C8B
RLHTPMYFFLLNLSLLDLGCISTTLPKAMANALWGTRAISYTGCAAQVFFFLFFISAECCLLTIMSYDRYVAICKPLHYRTLDLVVSFMYSVMPPALNPLIYGIRNQELKGALRKILQHTLFRHQKYVHYDLKTTKNLEKA